MFLEFYLFTNDLPNWADALQAVASIVGIPLTLYTLYKLVKKDKERESEIASLALIASQLKDILAHNEKRYVESKKPQMEIEIKRDMHYFLHFKNLNSNCQITKYERQDLRGIKGGMVSAIFNVGKEQSFAFSVSIRDKDIPIKIQLIYTVEDIYKFKQIVSIHNEGLKTVVKGGIIMLE